MSKVVSEAVGLALTADSRVDVKAGIIRGARVLGSKSKNGWTYPLPLLAQRYGVYEGAQVYADHDYAQLKTGKARPLAQWGGVLRNVTYRGEGIHGDIHCLKETAAGKIILEAARRCPDKFGLSAMHLIETRKEKDGTETVTAILECLSVDAVTRPATTRTLFEEQTMPDPAAPGAPAAPTASIEAGFNALHAALMASDEYDDDTKIKMWKEMNKLKAKWLGGDEEEEPAEGGEATEESHHRPLGRQAKAVAELTAAVRALTIRQMAGESLPIDAPTMAVLLGLPDDAAVSNYLEQLRRQRRPRYSAGPARSSGRTVATESVGARPAVVPRLTAGADREAVKKFYRG